MFYVSSTITRSQSTSSPELGDQFRNSRKFKNKNKDEGIDLVQGDMLRDLPEGLEEPRPPKKT